MTNDNSRIGAAHADVAHFSHDGYSAVIVKSVTADDLKSATLYDRGDEKLGSISDLTVSADGRITDAVVDIGGFLGIGAHAVSLPYADLTILRENGGDALRVYADTTQEKLKAMPRHVA